MLRTSKSRNGKWYNFRTDNGDVKRGFVKLSDGRTVYYDVDGEGNGRGMLYGFQLVDGVLYSFNQWNGNLNGIEKDTVYYDENTEKLQYFGSDGKIVSGKTITLDGTSYQIDSNGYLVLKNGENNVNGNWYLYDSQTGKLKTGWQIDSGNRKVYYDPTTAIMVHGEKEIDGSWYDFATNNGAMLTGFVNLSDGRTVYYEPTSGKMVHGEKQVDGHWRNFNIYTGAMAKAQFIKLSDGRLVYYDASGDMLYGWQKINGSEYYFATNNGDAARGDVWIDGKEYFFDSGTGAQITDSYTIKLISWFYHRIGKVTYSMYGSRNGSDGTADCSGSVTQALYEASGVPYSYLYNTESLHGYLIQNGYHLVHENSGYENDHRLGDVIIWGRKGYSAGEFGHTGIMTGSGSDAKMISTCYYTDGQKNTAVQNLNYNYYWNYDEKPYYYVYRK